MTAPWFGMPEPRHLPTERFAVVGAGLAGASAAYALAKRGVAVTLYERLPEAGDGTSGNPTGVVYPFVGLKPDPMTRFFDAAYRLALARIRHLEAQGRDTGARHIGAVHLLVKDRLKRLHQALWDGEVCSDLVTAVDVETAARISGLPLTEPVLHYPDACFVEPPLYTRAHLQEAGIHFQPDTKIEALAERETGIALFSEAGLLGTFDGVILANSDDAARLDLTAPLPFGRSRGQLMMFDRDLMEQVPHCVICHKGYLVPGPHDQVMIGATWSRDEHTDLQEQDQSDLLDESRAHIPGFALKGPAPLQGRVAFRQRTPDHLPIVGPLPDWSAYREAYTGLNHGRAHTVWPSAPYRRGLYLSLGHGGRGMVSCPFSGELLARIILGEMDGDTATLAQLVHPGRFLLRDLKRGR